MNNVTTALREPDRLAPSTLEAIRLAQEEAARMQAQAGYPEHLLLGTIAQGENKAAQMMCRCGLDMPAIRVRASEVFGSQYVASGNGDLPLSRESLECIAWAISLADRYKEYSLVLPEHLVLGVLRHPRMKEFLTPFSSSIELVQGYLTRELWASLIENAEDPLSIPEEIREQEGVVDLRADQTLWALGTVERPSIPSASIQGERLEEAKRALPEVVDFFKRSAHLPMGSGLSLMGLVLISSRKRSRTYLIKATATAAAVPLVSMSMPALLQLHHDIAAEIRPIESYGFPEDDVSYMKHSVIEKCIRNIFLHARRFAPCLLLIDDLDALNQIDRIDVRMRVLHQLSLDLQRLREDKSRRIAVVVTASDPESYERTVGPGQSNLTPLDRRVYMESPGQNTQLKHQDLLAEDFIRRREIQKELTEPTLRAKQCPSCKKEAQPGWKHCAYCGTSLMHICPKCGAAQPEIENARFCFECGSPLF